MTTSTKPPRRRRRVAAAALVLASGVAATGCSADAPSPDAGATSTAPAPTASAPATDRGAGATTVTEDGLSVQVPEGWKVTALTPAARQQALAGESDPRVAEFLRQRLEGLAAMDAVLYLYDLRAVLDGQQLATVEIYRYPSGRTPEEVVEDRLLPRLAEAGLAPVRGQADLPAGNALTLTSQTRANGREVVNEVYVLPLGPTTASMSKTTVGGPSPGADQIVQSLRGV